MISVAGLRPGGPGDGASERHRSGRILDRDFHANRGALGIDGRRYFPDVADGGHVRTRDQRQRYAAAIQIAKEHRFIDIEDGVALAVLRQRENRLGRLHDLPDLEASRGNHTRSAGVQFGIAKRIAGPSQLRLRRFKRAFCGSQLLLRLIEGDAGGEAVRQEIALPVKGRLRHAQLGLRRGHSCGRGVKIGLLLGRIEPGQDVAGIDVGADIHQAREHAPADTKREVGAETGLDFAGQRHGSLSVLRLHDFGVHERGALDGGDGAVIAGTQRRRQQHERECGTHRPRNGRRGRTGDKMVHGGLLL